MRAEALAAQLAADKAALNVRVAGLAAQVEHLTQTVATLSGLLFGDSSEKRNPGQQPGGGEDGREGDGRARPGGRGQRKGSRGHGRRSYAHLETEERIIDVEPGLRRCRCCGTDFEFLGTEDSEQLDWEVRLRRILWRRRRYRRRCQCPAKLAGRIAVCAPRPPKVIPRGLFTAMFLARLAYEKYVLGRPLHRIIAALAADGLDVAEGTLVGALQQVVPLLAPWAEAIEAHVAASGYVRADETGWRVFADTPGKDGNRWWLWVFGTDEATVFAMDPSRSAEVPAKVLGIDREQAALEAAAGWSSPPISTACTSRWPRSRASIRCVLRRYQTVLPAGRRRSPRCAGPVVPRLDAAVRAAVPGAHRPARRDHPDRDRERGARAGPGPLPPGLR